MMFGRAAAGCKAHTAGALPPHIETKPQRIGPMVLTTRFTFFSHDVLTMAM
jgi:hypothetical protein